jgi:hypothetical protein
MRIPFSFLSTAARIRNKLPHVLSNLHLANVKCHKVVDRFRLLQFQVNYMILYIHRIYINLVLDNVLRAFSNFVPIARSNN